MPLLLDTHAFLWFLGDDPRLSEAAARRISDPAERVLVSVASAWELTIKIRAGKLALDRPLPELWPAAMAASEFQTLDIQLEHVLTVGELPLHHRDPFDRLLIAQARTARLDLVSADAVFDAYDVVRVW